MRKRMDCTCISTKQKNIILCVQCCIIIVCAFRNFLIWLLYFICYQHHCAPKKMSTESTTHSPHPKSSPFRFLPELVTSVWRTAHNAAATVAADKGSSSSSSCSSSSSSNLPLLLPNQTSSSNAANKLYSNRNHSNRFTFGGGEWTYDLCTCVVLCSLCVLLLMLMMMKCRMRKLAYVNTN